MNVPAKSHPPSAKMVGYARFLARHAVAVVVACLLVTGISIALASKLSISTDLAALLPRGYPSVEDLHKLLARIGGTASLTVVVESPDLKANEQFAEALVIELRKDLGGQIANIDYKVDALASFYRKHAAVYLSKPDLLSIEDELKKGITDAKVKASPVPYELGLDDPPPAAGKSADGAFGGISKRLDEAQKDFTRFPDGYFAGEQGRLLAIFIRPRTSGADSQAAGAFIASVQKLVDRVDPKKFNPEMKISYTGAYQVSIDEQDMIAHDLKSTAGLCIGLIALAVTIYFRRIRAIALLGATLLCGCAWAFGLAAVAVGFLNLQTAFLGSIIAGTGINYGIILLARYLEERRNGAHETDALASAMEGTWIATLTAAATTAISFGTLLIARISSFQHFAIIGGGGIIFCWILSFTLLPALLLLSERMSQTVKHSGGGAHWPAFLVAIPLRFPRTIVLLSIALSALSVVALLRFLPTSLETDGRNLRNKSSGTSGSAKLDERVAQVRGQSMTPGFVVTDSLEEARLVCEVLNGRAKKEGDLAPVKGCSSIYSLLPEEAEDKLVIARRILERLDALPGEAFSAADKQKLDELRRQMVLETVTLEDLPEELIRPFREVSGDVGRLVAVYPPGNRDLWIAANLFAFTDAIRHIELPNQKVVTSSGDAVIFADILRMIQRDAPRTTLMALGGVLFFVLFALRGGRATAHVVGALLIGVLWMVGVASYQEVKINFFNFVALPTTFGIAVDYTINVYTRYKSALGDDRKARLAEALRETGGAVFLCAVTTIIGYSTLIIADNLALVSFGKLAILGELTCVLAALFLLPAALLLDKKA